MKTKESIYLPDKKKTTLKEGTLKKISISMTKKKECDINDIYSDVKKKQINHS